jgi:hypothetical protein
VPHAGICAGGRSKERSLPRSLLSRRARDKIGMLPLFKATSSIVIREYETLVRAT